MAPSGKVINWHWPGNPVKKDAALFFNRAAYREVYIITG